MKRLNVILCIVFFVLLFFTFLSRNGIAEQHADSLIPPKFHFHLSLQNQGLFDDSLWHPDAMQTDKAESSPEQKPKKHLGWAVLEYFALLAYSQTKYWVTYGDWIEDWHYELTWEDQKKRFFSLEAWKFDSNCFALNWSHALAGALYYNFARTNNLNRLESLLFTLGGSFYWEYIVEWRNVLSISDNIFTIIGGVPIGEAWYRLGKYFSDRSELGYRILGFLNPILKFNRWLDRREIAKWPQEPEPGWNKFDFFLGSRVSRSSSTDNYSGHLHGGFHTQIIHIPEFGKQGQISRNESDTLFSEIYLDISAGHKGVEEVNLFSRVVFFGRFKQNIDQQQRGFAYYFGLGSAFAYFKKRSVAFYDGCEVKVKQGYDLQLEEPRKFTDKFSVVHLAGPVFDLTSFNTKLKLRLVCDAYLDFALVNAYALNKYSEGRDISGIKTNLLYYGYYYGFGTTLSSYLNIRFGDLEFRGLLKYHAWGSLDGRDRFQEELTDDFHCKDSRLQYKFDLGYWIPGTSMELLGSFEGIHRKGNIKDIDHKELENRLFFGINFKF